MQFSHMIFGAVVVIAAICGTEGIPKPQNFVEVDGFAFNGPVDRSGASPNTNGPSLVETESTPPSDPLISGPESTPPSNTPAVDPISTVPVTQSPEVARCIQNCRFQVTSEFNPVCGSDRSVYSNPGMLNCVKGCGHDVNHAYFGPCSSQIRG